MSESKAPTAVEITKADFNKLVDEVGPVKAIEAMYEETHKHIPRIYTPVVNDDQLINTIAQLDAAVSDILEAGKIVEESFQDKMEYVGIARQLETLIQLTESEAICTIVGSGKDAYGIWTDEAGQSVKVACNNDTQRDAFRRMFSAKDRKEQAKVEARVKELDILYLKAKENYNAKVEALSCIRAKAQLQAAALTYLA